jgi:hydroxymethylglutaryl-CoA lyase
MPGDRHIEVVEVGPRDGFQMEHKFIPTETKVDVINSLIGCGIRKLEVTSFVSPRAVPQMRDAAEVMAGIDRTLGARLAALVPNVKGAENAARAKVDEMVVFLSVSESHNKSNVNRSVEESLEGFRAVMDVARVAKIPVHSGIATSFGCPFEGNVPVERVKMVVGRLLEMGVQGIGLGDTTGMATPRLVRERVETLTRAFPNIELTLHFHNTRGIGLVNAFEGLNLGVKIFESSIAGLGGCPFAPGASGNICTEDLVYMLHEAGYETGIDLGKLIEVARRVERVIGRELPGQVMKAGPRSALHSLTGSARAVG